MSKSTHILMITCSGSLCLHVYYPAAEMLHNFCGSAVFPCVPIKAPESSRFWMRLFVSSMSFLFVTRQPDDIIQIETATTPRSRSGIYALQSPVTPRSSSAFKISFPRQVGTSARSGVRNIWPQHPSSVPSPNSAPGGFFFTKLFILSILGL